MKAGAQLQTLCRLLERGREIALTPCLLGGIVQRLGSRRAKSAAAGKPKDCGNQRRR